MSIFWDPKKHQPQIWVYPFFIFLTIAVFSVIFLYGFSKNAEQEDQLGQSMDASK